ncbi:tail fiber assembly protein [Pantoea sp. Fr-CA_6]|uniref:tail fiber assembly protein n=1 Tax=Pantoea sp. Fr-CA_6 TaxID=2929505 RepID=UPI0021197AC0|nr:tail fiber assembly protein [Pantoea sp. Fr-CA_6]
MENKYYYAPSTGGFYQSLIHAAIPEDALEITGQDYLALLEGQSAGSEIISGHDGWPVLAEPEGPTRPELIAAADNEKLRLLSVAALKIAPLQDAADFDEQTKDEVAALKAWKNYRIKVNRVDTSIAPDISWPVTPA